MEFGIEVMKQSFTLSVPNLKIQEQGGNTSYKI
jgi:hypothetical protein